MLAGEGSPEISGRPSKPAINGQSARAPIPCGKGGCGRSLGGQNRKGLGDENGWSRQTTLLARSFALFASLRFRFSLFLTAALICPSLNSLWFPSSNALTAPLSLVAFPSGLSRMPPGHLRFLKKPKRRRKLDAWGADPLGDGGTFSILRWPTLEGGPPAKMVGTTLLRRNSMSCATRKWEMCPNREETMEMHTRCAAGAALRCTTAWVGKMTRMEVATYQHC
jgi:hypothetical protein